MFSPVTAMKALGQSPIALQRFLEDDRLYRPCRDKGVEVIMLKRIHSQGQCGICGHIGCHCFLGIFKLDLTG